MKKHLVSLFAFFALLTVGCNNEDVIDSMSQEMLCGDSLYTVSFGTADFEIESDTRAATDKTIYGINIEYFKNGTRQGYYAYGLFNDMSKASITLIGGFTYNFTCSIVRSAGDALWYGPYSGNTFSGYAEPFQLNNSPSTQCLNKFIEGTSNYLSGLSSGESVIKSSSASIGYELSYYPSLERYYGKLNSFNPATDGTKVIIPVKKAFFGCKLILKGVTDGRLESRCSSDSDIKFLTASTTTEDFIGNPKIITFPDVAACWTNNSYSMKETVRYDYTSNRCSLQGSPGWWNMYGTKEITFKRNVLTTITIHVTEDLSGAAVGIGDETLGEDNIIEFVLDENYNLYQKDN